MSQPLTVRIDGHIATVTLCRPEVRNAFDERLIGQLTDAFTTLSERDDLRCIVLAAEGKAFCAGGDLAWMRRMADFSREENLSDAAGLAGMLSSIATCPVPVIARIHGDVYAGGVGLVSACDIAVSVDTAAFCLSEARIGLAPATISPYVIRAIGRRAAQRYFLSAERFTADEAHRIGLVHEVVTADALDTTIQRIITAITACGPGAVRAGKSLIDAVADAPLDQTLIDMTAARIADLRASDEGREGLQAFLAKRPPSWTIGSNEESRS